MNSKSETIEISQLRALLATDAENGRLWAQLGNALYSDGKVAAALSALETASVLIPLTHEEQAALAACYLEEGYPESAHAIYLHLARQTNLGTGLLEQLSEGLRRVGEQELALAVCREATQRTPEAAWPWLILARQLRRQRRSPVAVLPYLRRAFKLDPKSTACRISLAWILHTCGRSADGAELLDTVAVSEVECVPSLTFMQRVFEAAEDEYCASACKYRLEALAAQRWRHRP